MADVADVLDRPAEARVQRLRRMTHAMHEELDGYITAASPFADRSRYGGFLVMQRRFHQEIDSLYQDAELTRIIPDLPERRRLALIDRDLEDLGLPIPADAPSAEATGRGAALGWLYVAEGSNLGAAFLLKAAARLGLDENFGARHLAAHPDGRGLNWRRFVEAVDSAALSPDEDEDAERAAVEAFRRVRVLAGEALGA